MVLPAVFSFFFPWRSLLSNRHNRRPETDTEQSSPTDTYIPPCSAPYNANGEKVFPTPSNSSFRHDRDHTNPTPAPSDHHHYAHTRIRSLLLISSIFVPFSILLAIPGLTGHWYIRTNHQHEIVEYEPNPAYLRVMLGFSMAFAGITNLCLLVRLFEKLVKWMTIVCIILLTLHDILATAVLIIFIIKTQTDDGFILGQAFWATLCSTVAAFLANVTLILDYLKTPSAERDEGGLTKKQQALATNMFGLFCYIAFGAAIHVPLVSLSYIDALYFTVVCIETIGYGDIAPQTTGARIFTSLYTSAGIVIIVINVGLIRESLLEAIQHNIYARIRGRWKKRIKHRWEVALKWRLEHAGLPVWIPVTEKEEEEEREEEEEEYSGARGLAGKWRNFSWRSLQALRLRTLRRLHNLIPRRNHNRRHMKLNLRALTKAQLQAAAMEAGAPLKELLPDHFHSRTHHGLYEYVGGGQTTATTPTHYRMGMMITLLGDFAYSFSMGQHGSSRRVEEGGDVGQLDNAVDDDVESGGSGLTMEELQLEEKKYFVARIAAALALFFTFWLVGSAIFSATEGWTYSLSLYFCFVTFSTVGYGDPVPKTPAGRSIFIGWALCGVGTMTILISLLADRYAEEYKDIISAAQSSISMGMKKTQNTTRMTIVPPTPPIMRNSEAALTVSPPPQTVVDYTNTLTPNNDQRHGDAVFGNEELLSRVHTLKELIVDEGAFREGRLLHTFESELQNMLSHLRRSRQETEQRAFME